MKVLYILSSSVMGGATLSFLSLLEGMITLGNKAIVLVPNDYANSGLFNKLDSLSVKYYRIPFSLSIYPFTDGLKNKVLFPSRFIFWPIRFIYSLLRVYRIVKEEKPDIIHTNVGVISVGHWIAKFLHIPHIWHLREYQDLDFGMNFFPSKKSFVSRLGEDYPIAITRGVFNHFDLDQNSRSCQIYNGVRAKDDIIFNPIKEKYFLCASRVSPEKGHDLAIKAFSTFHKKHNDYSLVILGNGDINYISYLKQLSVDLKCDTCIHFLGHKTNVSEYMSKAMALIVASASEAFGRMTAEACFAGCIVIGKNSAGTKEVLTKTGGYLFDSIDDLASDMEKLSMLSIDEYSRLALSAQKVAQDNYSIESYVNSVMDLYNEVLHKSI